ncbi:MAG TPA: DUF4383 domain-containing protein [Candidatus Eisenbacteria bacterium]|nr:DUF4383 domain-containing protein [Candidatus Eisenbacteria bacterium]
MIKRVAMAFGVIYLAAGILGMLPFLGGTFGMTPSNLLTIFSINLLHNLVHVGLGIAGLAAASSERNSRQYAQIVGIALLLLGVIGISDPVHGVLPLGGVDIVLHLLTGAVLAYFGFTTPVARRTA